jgi:hypothetical protein
MAVTPVHAVEDASRTIVDDLGIGDRPEAAELQAQISAEESARTPSDRRATIGFIATLFAIHLARMAPDGTLLGLVAPGVAVLGDMLLAVLFATVIVIPVVLSFRKSNRWLERLSSVPKPAATNLAGAITSRGGSHIGCGSPCDCARHDIRFLALRSLPWVCPPPSSPPACRVG